jgi:hypothetical protein
VIRVGADLHADLIDGIAASAWDDEDEQDSAERVLLGLRTATPLEREYQIDDSDWEWDDYAFLRSILIDVVIEDNGHTAMSRGIELYTTPIGRQILALKEQL